MSSSRRHSFHTALSLPVLRWPLWQHLPFLRVPPGPDDDIHRYVWDGRLQRLGYSPYVVVPSDPSVRELHTTETLGLNNPDDAEPVVRRAPSYFFRAVTAISRIHLRAETGIFGLRFLTNCLLAVAGRSASRADSRAHWALAHAWNPLLAIEVAGSGHIDIVGALLLLMSFAALGRRSRAIAAVGFAPAVCSRNSCRSRCCPSTGNAFESATLYSQQR